MITLLWCFLSFLLGIFFYAFLSGSTLVDEMRKTEIRTAERCANIIDSSNNVFTNSTFTTEDKKFYSHAIRDHFKVPK